MASVVRGTEAIGFIQGFNFANPSTSPRRESATPSSLSSRKELSPLLLPLLLIFISLFKPSHVEGIVVYWGQNDNINIAFLSMFGGGQTPQLNLTGHYNPSINNCNVFSDQIKGCQSRGIKVLPQLRRRRNTSC